MCDTEIYDIYEVTDDDEVTDPETLVVQYSDYSLGYTVLWMDDPRIPALLDKWIECREADLHEAQVALDDARVTRDRILARRAKGG